MGKHVLSSWPLQDKTVCCWVIVKRYGGQKHTLALGICKWCMKLWSKWGDHCVRLMSALLWSLRMFCYLCPLGSCVSLCGGTGCSPGEGKGTKGQAAAWWMSANSVDWQCSRQLLVRESIAERAVAYVHECKNNHLPYCSKSSSLLKMALEQTYNDAVFGQFIYQSELDSATLCSL